MSDSTEPLEHTSHEGRTFAALFEREAPLIYAWAAARLHRSERALAEDLVQEVWLRALNLYGGMDASEAGFRNWLFAIAHRTRLELLRQLACGAGRGGASSGFDLDRVPAEITSVSSRIARDEQVQGFLDRVGLLEKDEHELLELRGFQELPWTVIAQDLGLTAEVARQRYSRLLARLRAEGAPAWLND